MINNPDWIYEYACDGCGACCRCFSIPVNEDDLRREPTIKFHIDQDYGSPLMNTKGGACPFLTEHGSCNIYATKPGVCTRFAGGAGCQHARGRAGLGMLHGRWKPRTVPLKVVA